MRSVWPRRGVPRRVAELLSLGSGEGLRRDGVDFRLESRDVYGDANDAGYNDTNGLESFMVAAGCRGN